MSALGPSTSIARSLVSLPLVSAATLLYSAIASALALLGRSAEDVHRAYLGLGRFCMKVAGTTLIVHGAEHMDPGQAYVVVSNHESNWDSFVLIAALPQLLVRFVAKRQLLQIPIFGRALRLTGNIIVDRNRSGADLKRIESQMSVRAQGRERATGPSAPSRRAPLPRRSRTDSRFCRSRRPEPFPSGRPVRSGFARAR
jgi:1-acyl-sn-glycerol-3-phosphate acyltransferase